MAGFSLVGSRIALQLLAKEHLKKRVEFLNDVEVQRTLNFDYPTSIAKTEAWFSKNVLSTNRIDFTFIRNDDSAVIGFGGLININTKARKAELYIFIGDKSCWGEGYGRDGYKLLVNYGFAELGLERIYLYQLSQNERAIKATTALGWKTEGLLRRDIWSHGELKDQYLLSILRQEWEESGIYAET
ncbi:GNAT family N-acetyltransferase [Halopseudomonas pertucinogena]|uniref:N-acetyltransferase n=1 Tax=Halopseudomonas pertucinogena TaxID=86175 RepID=A0ABQ2CRU2_9GAMM|nr:GNAT family protein [Halopseudomonas pertucinogena]GGI96870.1 N-acetyltransferase [Halopseudomonas pertucinogena]